MTSSSHMSSTLFTTCATTSKLEKSWPRTKTCLLSKPSRRSSGTCLTMRKRKRAMTSIRRSRKLRLISSPWNTKMTQPHFQRKSVHWRKIRWFLISLKKSAKINSKLGFKSNLWLQQRSIKSSARLGFRSWLINNWLVCYLNLALRKLRSSFVRASRSASLRTSQRWATKCVSKSTPSPGNNTSYQTSHLLT